MATNSMVVGQRVREARPGMYGRLGTVWVVDKLYTGRDRLDYACLICVSDTSERKTLSVGVLRDPRRWVTVEG